jgi:1-phosphatidylinositol-3-phosphate 5-kinase
VQDVRRGFSEVSCAHLHRIIAQLMSVEQISDIPMWLPIIQRLAIECALQLSPVAVAAHRQQRKSLDPRQFIKVKKIADNSPPTASCVVQGVVFTKNLTHRAMPRVKANARVLLLEGALEYQKSEQLQALDTIIPKEAEYMRTCVKKALRFRPDVILVEKSVSRLAQVCWHRVRDLCCHELPLTGKISDLCIPCTF